uniref:Uncharacterized protein n=1 Tax=Octopus bimaculoides TaxID=37653 RepID=A0A0L8HH99_OCTBM
MTMILPHAANLTKIAIQEFSWKDLPLRRHILQMTAFWGRSPIACDAFRLTCDLELELENGVQ